MIVRIALLLVGIPVLAHGADALYHALRSGSQAVLSCEAFLRERPATGWVSLTACEVDYLRAGFRMAGGEVGEVLLPLRPEGASPDTPAGIVLSTRDPAALAQASRAVDGAASGNQDAFLVAMLAVVTETRVSRAADGMTRPPLERLRTRRSLSAIKAPVTNDAAILDLRERPRVSLAALETLLGVLGVSGALFLWIRARRRAGTAAEGIPAALDSGTVPALLNAAIGRPTPEFRRLMLVNLPIHAAASALDEAPPLGPQEDIRAAFGRVLPGITFNDFGLGQVNRADHTILLDLGTAPQVWSATLDVTGEAAPAALRSLITQTGWRAYAPRLGRFITADDLR